MCIRLLALMLLPGLASAAELQEGQLQRALRAAAPEATTLRDPLKDSVHPGETSLADQTDVAVTAYNNGRALVRDRRQIKLLPGESALRFMDVASAILPETVSIKSLTSPGDLVILEQNYEYDLMRPEALMDKYVGKRVRLVNKSSEYTFFEEDATLLSNNDGPIYQVGDDIYLGHPGSVVLPEIPDALIAKPTLVWLLQNSGTEHEIEVTYLTGGLSWKADYVTTLAADETTMDIEGWVTLTNESGTTYTDAQLKLVAGDVNIVRDQPQRMLRRDAAPQMAMANVAPMEEESFAEYHLYTLPRKTTLKQNQTKQVRLLGANGVAVKKAYEFRGRGHYYAQPLPQDMSEKVGVFLEFDNKAETGLGMPIPAGIMRVYQEDSDEMLQFAGEDRLEHTPEDEEIRLRLGNAFDITGERVQTDFQRVGNNLNESAYRITLRNHKNNPIDVDVVETIPGDWEILDATQDHVKKDARTAVFTVAIPADGETELRYRTRVRF